MFDPSYSSHHIKTSRFARMVTSAKGREAQLKAEKKKRDEKKALDRKKRI